MWILSGKQKEGIFLERILGLTAFSMFQAASDLSRRVWNGFYKVKYWFQELTHHFRLIVICHSLKPPNSFPIRPPAKLIINATTNKSATNTTKEVIKAENDQTAIKIRHRHQDCWSEKKIFYLIMNSVSAYVSPLVRHLFYSAIQWTLVLQESTKLLTLRYLSTMHLMYFECYFTTVKKILMSYGLLRTTIKCQNFWTVFDIIHSWTSFIELCKLNKWWFLNKLRLFLNELIRINLSIFTGTNDWWFINPFGYSIPRSRV